MRLHSALNLRSYRWRTVPASIPALGRSGAVRRETSRVRISSTRAGLRAVVVCRESHLELVDHQQHLRAIPSVFAGCPVEHLDSRPACGVIGEAGATCWAGTVGRLAKAAARGVGVFRPMACANASALR